MNPGIAPRGKATINVRDEKEFKLWVKFIASVHREGGDIRKPIDVLWKSIETEIKSSEKECKSKKRDLVLS